LCEKLETVADINEFDIIACVPLSRERQRERGYNQAAVLAKYTARCFELPFDSKLLVRDENALRQSTLRREERRANVQSAFRVNDKIIEKVQKDVRAAGYAKDITKLLFTGLRVILIDDVATSMSTLNACAAALKSAGAAEVLGAVLAAPVD
jgi:predicted amidophosphoribosyltransferase